MNKPRLIDANELKNIIDGSEEFIDWQKREICECIDCCDTAYDVDKVVEQLEDHLTGWVPVECIYDAIKIAKGGAK